MIWLLVAVEISSIIISLDNPLSHPPTISFNASQIIIEGREIRATKPNSKTMAALCRLTRNP